MAKFKIELGLRIEGKERRILLTDYDSTRESNIINTFEEELTEEEYDAHTLNFGIVGIMNEIPYKDIINIRRPL